ncbi:hypothetical protein [Rhodococcus koreensis]|nr:hypothetical protein [Rhodococcus koreensis]
MVSSTLYRLDGTVETTRDPAVWTLAHRGYSGCGRLDVGVYRTQADALQAGATLVAGLGSRALGLVFDGTEQARTVAYHRTSIA